MVAVVGGDVCACCGVGSVTVDNMSGIMASLCDVDMVGFGGDGVGCVVVIYVVVVVGDIWREVGVGGVIVVGALVDGVYECVVVFLQLLLILLEFPKIRGLVLFQAKVSFCLLIQCHMDL